MSKYLSTLGYTPNPLIEEYQALFLRKLKDDWKNSLSDLLPSEEFLLFPDIHSLILALKKATPEERTIYREILLKEFNTINTSKSILLPKKNAIIPGTAIELTEEFYNPDAKFDTHPDHDNHEAAMIFGEKSEQDWQDLFAQSFAIVQRVSPGFMSEIERFLKKIIPLGISHKVHNSGSYSSAIGQIFMSYPTGIDHPELALLEAILHEYNHNKLNLIMQIEPLILNARDEIYYSPYRPDARPIHGVYLGLHALTGAYWVIWNAHVEGILHLPSQWLEKAALYVLKNGLSLQVIDAHAELSPIGRTILEEMREVHRECLGFMKKSNLSSEMIRRVKEDLIAHYDNVRKRNPRIRN